MTLRILSGNGALQIMPFWKLGGKCHFFLRFCMRKRSKTYICISFITSHATHIHAFLVLKYKLKQIKIIPTTFKMSFFKNRMFFPNKRHDMIKCCVLPDLKQSMAQIQHLMKTIGNSQNPDLIVIKSFGWK